VELSELAALVAENPDVIDPFLVYADQLQEAGDPRGELITLELSLLENPRDAERARAVARHFDRHRHELLGPLAELSACLSDVHWHLGFIKRVTFLHPQHEGPRELARWTELLLEAPAGKFLRELTVMPLLGGDYTPVIDTLARHGASLYRLRLGPPAAQWRSPVRMDLAGAPPGSFARLRELALAATRVHLGVLELPQLESLDLWVDTFTAENLHDLATNSWPNLRSLAIAFSQGRSELPRLFLGSFPRLESLRLDAREPDELVGFVAALARSEVAHRLTSLTIDGVGLEAIERLVDSAGVFQALKQLSISSRGNMDDLLDRFREQNVQVTFRRSTSSFDPWEEQTEVDFDQQEESFELIDLLPDFTDEDEEDTGTIYLDMTGQ
jgi:uncharacterized protein (TIGR02996 family)